MGAADGCLIAGTPSAVDALQEAQALAGASSVTLDLTALLTIAYLGLLDRLRQRFSRIHVQQFVLDALNTTLARDYLMAKPVMTVGKETGYYVHSEVAAEDLEVGRKFIETIRTFVESVMIVPAATALDVEPGQLKRLTEIFGQDGIASILAAKECATVLYSDDLRVRQIASREWQVQAVWTQTVLADMRDRGLLTSDEYHDALRRLALANYGFVNMNVDDFVWILTQNAMCTTAEVSRILGLLHSPTDENAAIRLVADLLKKVWLEPLMDHQKLLLLDALLQSLATGRLSARVLAKLKAVLHIRFALLPIPLATILRNIDLWQRQHFLPNGPL